MHIKISTYRIIRLKIALPNLDSKKVFKQHVKKSYNPYIRPKTKFCVISINPASNSDAIDPCATRADLQNEPTSPVYARPEPGLVHVYSKGLKTLYQGAGKISADQKHIDTSVVVVTARSREVHAVCPVWISGILEEEITGNSLDNKY